MGVKPLFYAIRDDSLVFGSEPKACFAHPAVKPELDKQGLQELLAIGPAHTSGLSLFKDLFEVLPGHFMITPVMDCMTKPIGSLQVESTPRAIGIPLPTRAFWWRML